MFNARAIDGGVYMIRRPPLGRLVLAILLVFIAVGGAPAQCRTVCASAQPVAGRAVRPVTPGLSAPAPTRPLAVCALVGGFEVAVGEGRGWLPAGSLIRYVIRAAGRAAVDPRLLLAVLIRESGDGHSLDWLSRTPVAWLHHFSIGIANMEFAAFEEARAYSKGAVSNGWRAIGSDSAKAITAAAFLLAKRGSQLVPGRSANLTDTEYIRIGYRAGYRVMAAAQRTGRYTPGVELFDLAYRTAAHLINPAGDHPLSTCAPPA
ncbi:MAG TPA: hypothetical protein VJT31_28985 [Rugosimonospora sp.]|nr:hypothetical protein [Rugosimonospora sp.]